MIPRNKMFGREIVNLFLTRSKFHEMRHARKRKYNENGLKFVYMPDHLHRQLNTVHSDDALQFLKQFCDLFL